MALAAGRLRVAPREGESGQVVVNAGPLPALRCVALGAVGTKLASVQLVGLVASDTGLWRAGVGVAAMALGAGRLQVTACERIGGQVMVNAGSLPALRCVALGAIGPKLSSVAVVGLVAGDTGLWRAGIGIVGMAQGAGHSLMLAQ